jgi:hypothetical protein
MIALRVKWLFVKAVKAVACCLLQGQTHQHIQLGCCCCCAGAAAVDQLMQPLAPALPFTRTNASFSSFSLLQPGLICMHVTTDQLTLAQMRLD